MSTQRNCCCKDGTGPGGLQVSCLGGDKFFTREGDVPHNPNQFGSGVPSMSLGYRAMYNNENLANPQDYGVNNGNSCMLCTNVLVQKNSNFPYSIWGTETITPGGAMGLVAPEEDSVSDAPRISGDHLAALDLYYGGMRSEMFDIHGFRSKESGYNLQSPVSTYNFHRIISLNPSDADNPVIDFPVYNDKIFKNNYIKRLEKYKESNKFHVFNMRKKKRKLRISGRGLPGTPSVKVPYFTVNRNNQKHMGLSPNYAVLDYLSQNNSLIFIFQSRQDRDKFILDTEYVDMNYIESSNKQYRSKEISPVTFTARTKAFGGNKKTHGVMVVYAGEQSTRTQRVVDEIRINENVRITLWGYEGNPDPTIPINVIGSEQFINRLALQENPPPETGETIEILDPNHFDKVNQNISYSDPTEDEDEELEQPLDKTEAGLKRKYGLEIKRNATDKDRFKFSNRKQVAGPDFPFPELTELPGEFEKENNLKVPPGLPRDSSLDVEIEEEDDGESVEERAAAVGSGGGGPPEKTVQCCCSSDYLCGPVTVTCPASASVEECCKFYIPPVIVPGGQDPCEPLNAASGCPFRICCDWNYDSDTAICDCIDTSTTSCPGALHPSSRSCGACSDIVVCPKCCLPDGTCREDLTMTACSDSGGICAHQTGGLGCPPNGDPCPITGSCCYCNGDCREGILEADCIANGGRWNVWPTTCNDLPFVDDLGRPVGCVPTGSCCTIYEDGTTNCESVVMEPDCLRRAQPDDVDETIWTQCAYCPGDQVPTEGNWQIVDCDGDPPVNGGDVGDIISTITNTITSNIGSINTSSSTNTSTNSSTNTNTNSSTNTSTNSQTNSSTSTSTNTIDPVNVTSTITSSITNTITSNITGNVGAGTVDPPSVSGDGGAAFYTINKKTQVPFSSPVYTLFHHIKDYWYFDWGRDSDTFQALATPAGVHGIGGEDPQVPAGFPNDRYVPSVKNPVPFTYPGQQLTNRYRGNPVVYGFTDVPNTTEEETIFNPITAPSTDGEDDNCVAGISNVNLVCEPSMRQGMDPRSVWSAGGYSPPNPWGNAGIGDSLDDITVSNLANSTLAVSGDTPQTTPHHTPALLSGYWPSPLEGSAISGERTIAELLFNAGGNVVYVSGAGGALDVWRHQWAGNGIHSLTARQGGCSEIGPRQWNVPFVPKSPYQSNVSNTAYQTNGKSGLSDWQLNTMAATQDSRWLLDIMSYADGKPIFWSPFRNQKANLHDCLVGTMHRMRVFVRGDFWTESLTGPFMTCPDDPFASCFRDEEDLRNLRPQTFYPPVVNDKMQASAAGCQSCLANNEDPTCPYKDFVKYCTTPKYWVYKCSGVPIFDFELWGLMLEGKLSMGDIRNIRNPDHLNYVYGDNSGELERLPALRAIGSFIQDFGDKLWDAGILEMRDWRDDQRYLYRTWDQFLGAGSEGSTANDGRYAGMNKTGGRIASGMWGGACCFKPSEIDQVPRCDLTVDSPEQCEEEGGDWKNPPSLTDPPISGDGAKSELLPVRKRSVIFIKDEDDIDFDPTDKTGLHFITRDIYENAMAQANFDFQGSGDYYNTADLRIVEENGKRIPVSLSGKWGTCSGIQPLTPSLINMKRFNGTRLSGEMPVYNPTAKNNRNPFRDQATDREVVETNGWGVAGNLNANQAYPNFGNAIPGTRAASNDPRWLPYPNENDEYDIRAELNNLDPSDFESEEEYDARVEFLENEIEEQKNLIRYYKIYLANNPIYLHAKPGGWSFVPIVRPSVFGFVGSIQPWDLLSSSRGGPYVLLDFFGFENAPCWSHPGGSFPSVAFPFGTQIVRFNWSPDTFTGIPQFLPRASDKNSRLTSWNHPFRDCAGERCTASSSDPCNPPEISAPCDQWYDLPQIGIGPAGCANGLSQYGGCNDVILTSNNYGVRILEKAVWQQGTCPGENIDCQRIVPIDEFWRTYYQETLLFPFDLNCVASDLDTRVKEPAEFGGYAPPGTPGSDPPPGDAPIGPTPGPTDNPDRREIITGGDGGAIDIVGCIEWSETMYNSLLPRPNNLRPEFDKIWIGGKIRENSHNCGEDPCACGPCAADNSNCNSPEPKCGRCYTGPCESEPRSCQNVYGGGIVEYGVIFNGPDQDRARTPHGWYVPWIIDYEWGEAQMDEWCFKDGGDACDNCAYYCPLNRTETNIQPSPLVFGHGSTLIQDPFGGVQRVPEFVSGVCKLPYHCPYEYARKGASEYSLDTDVPGGQWRRCGFALDGPPTPHDCYDQGADVVTTRLEIKTLKRVKTNEEGSTLFLDELDGGNSNTGYPTAFLDPANAGDEFNPGNPETAEDVEMYCSTYRSNEEFEETGIATDIPTNHWLNTELPKFKEVRFFNILNPTEPHIRQGSKWFGENEQRLITGTPIGWKTFKDLDLHVSDNLVVGGVPQYPGWSPPEIVVGDENRPIPKSTHTEGPNQYGFQEAAGAYRFFSLQDGENEGRRVGAIIPFGGWFCSGRFLEPGIRPANAQVEYADPDNGDYTPKYVNHKVRGDAYVLDTAYIHWNTEGAQGTELPIEDVICLQCSDEEEIEGCVVQPGEVCPTPVNPARGIVAGMPRLRYDNFAKWNFSSYEDVDPDDPIENYRYANSDFFSNYGPPFDVTFRSEDIIGINNRYEASKNPILDTPEFNQEKDRTDLADGEFRHETVLGRVGFVFEDHASMNTAMNTLKMGSMKFRIHEDSSRAGFSTLDWPLGGRYELTSPKFIRYLDENTGICDQLNLTVAMTHAARPSAMRYNDYGYYIWDVGGCDSTSEPCVDDSENESGFLDKYEPNMILYDIRPIDLTLRDEPELVSQGGSRAALRSYAAPVFTELGTSGTMVYDPVVDSPFPDSPDGVGTKGCSDPWSIEVAPSNRIDYGEGNGSGCPGANITGRCAGSLNGPYNDACSCHGFRNCLEAFYARLHWEIQEYGTCVIEIDKPDCALFGDYDSSVRPTCFCSQAEANADRCEQQQEVTIPGTSTYDGETVSIAERCCDAFSSNPLYYYCNDGRFGGWDENCTQAFETYMAGSPSPFCKDLYCGSPDTGLCCTAHETPFCSDEVCCSAVCDIDPTCCEAFGIGWDEVCVDLARSLDVCGCDQKTGACCPPAACGDDAGGVGNLTTPQTAGGGGDPVGCDEECIEAQTEAQCTQRPGWTWHEDEPCCICQRNEDDQLENVCPDPVGACCYGSLQCADGLTEQECVASGGIFQGADTYCESGICQDSSDGTQAGGEQAGGGYGV